jgi:light-regulated signal transduction histidine kinase (bacteriophytochrome)
MMGAMATPDPRDPREYLVNAAHDLRDPLVAMRHLVELLASRHGEQLDAEGQEIVALLREGIATTQGVIDEVLADARRRAA